MATVFNCQTEENKYLPIKPERPDVYSNEDLSKLPEFEPIVKTSLYIIQPKVDDFFHPNITHEIFNEKKHLLFKGIIKKKLFSRQIKNQHISISNLKKCKIVSLEFNEDKLCSMSHEAIISCPPGTPRGRVTKYGGKYEQPSFEVTSVGEGKQILFSMENSQQASSHPNGNSSGILPSVIDYTIRKGGHHKVAQVTSKSGLNFMLHVKDTLSPLDKAVLLGLIIAMDVLKQGKSARKENDYEYNT